MDDGFDPVRCHLKGQHFEALRSTIVGEFGTGATNAYYSQVLPHYQFRNA